jgi:hypothetical protein
VPFILPPELPLEEWVEHRENLSRPQARKSLRRGATALACQLGELGIQMRRTTVEIMEQEGGGDSRLNPMALGK